MMFTLRLFEGLPQSVEESLIIGADGKIRLTEYWLVTGYLRVVEAWLPRTGKLGTLRRILSPLNTLLLSLRESFTVLVR